MILVGHSCYSKPIALEESCQVVMVFGIVEAPKTGVPAPWYIVGRHFWAEPELLAPSYGSPEAIEPVLSTPPHLSPPQCLSANCDCGWHHAVEYSPMFILLCACL